MPSSDLDQAAFRKRLEAALSIDTGTSFLEGLKDQAPYGDHDLRFTSIDVPATLKIKCTVRCPKCGWRFFSLIDLLVGAKDKETDRAILVGTFYNLIRRFSAEVDRDCKTASLMATVMAVHRR